MSRPHHQQLLSLTASGQSVRGVSAIAAIMLLFQPILRLPSQPSSALRASMSLRLTSPRLLSTRSRQNPSVRDKIRRLLAVAHLLSLIAVKETSTDRCMHALDAVARRFEPILGHPAWIGAL